MMLTNTYPVAELYSSPGDFRQHQSNLLDIGARHIRLVKTYRPSTWQVLLIPQDDRAHAFF